MEKIIRIDASSENLQFDTKLTLIEILDKYLLQFNFASIFELIVRNLSKYNYLEAKNNINEYYQFHKDITNAIAKNRLTGNYFDYIITIFTRTNAILIINYIFYRKNNLGTKTIHLEDLFELLLIINYFEESETPSLINVLNNKNKKITLSDSLTLAAYFIKANSFQNVAILRLPNMDRSYKMINELLQSPEGIECNNDFINDYGFDIKEYFCITTATYHFLYYSYMQNDFSNIINFNLLFDNLVNKNSPELKLKNNFIKVFERLSTHSKTATENDITLYNTEYLWENNIIKIDTGIYRIIDIGLYISAIFTNVYLTFETPYLTKLQQNNTSSYNNPLRSNALGTSFENFCNNLINNFNSKKDLNKYYKRKKRQPKNEIADFFFRIDDVLFFIECKSGYLGVKNFIYKKADEFIEIIFKKYGGKYIDENHYTTIPSSEKKGTIQILHNYTKLNEAIIRNDFSNYEDEKQLENELKFINKVYGIVLVEEPHLSSLALNTYLYLSNLPATNNLKTKQFYPPIYVYVNDLYKIIYNEDVINGKKLTFKDAIINYLQTLESEQFPKNIYSFNDYLVNEWNYPVELSDKEGKNLLHQIMNEIYINAGLEPPNL